MDPDAVAYISAPSQSAQHDADASTSACAEPRPPASRQPPLPDDPDSQLRTYARRSPSDLLQHLCGQIASLAAALTRQQEELHATQAELHTTQTQLHTVCSELHCAQADIAELRATLSVQQQDLQAQQEHTHTLASTAALDDMRAAIATRQSELQIVSTELRTLAHDFSSLRTSSTEQRATLDTILTSQQDIRRQLEDFLHTSSQPVPSSHDDTAAQQAAARLSELEKEVHNAKSSLVGDTLQEVVREQQRRDFKSLNVRVRGLPAEGQPHHCAKAFLHARFPDSEQHLVSAWRARSDPAVIFIRFASLQARTDFLRQRSTLRGTTIFLDDDLTHAQWQLRKTLIHQARQRGQRVAFQQGVPRYFPRRK